MNSDDLRFIDAAKVRAYRPPGAAHPRVEIEGDRTILAARIKRAFPLSAPTGHVSLQDGAGKEIGLMSSIEGLDPESKAQFEDELNRRYFTPQIRAILSLKQDAGMWRFLVRTQRGETTFFVRNWRDSAIEIQPFRWLIQSVDGQRFEIKSLDELDKQSRNLMELLF